MGLTHHLMTRTDRASDEHPIAKTVFESAYREFDDPETGFERSYYHQLLARVQEAAEDGQFWTLLEQTSNNTKNELERVYDYDDPDAVAFVDYGVISTWEDLFREAGISDPHAREFVTTVHTEQVKRADPDLVGPIEETEVTSGLVWNELREDGWVGMLLGKPDEFRAGERNVTGHLEQLLRQGMTPAEVLDYLFVELEAKTQTEWAEIRERDQSTISENVAKARENLNSDRALYADPPQAMIEGYRMAYGGPGEDDTSEGETGD